MPSTILEIDEFALATLDGRDCGYVPATLEIDYFRDGSWKLVDIALTAHWRDEAGERKSRLEWDLPVDLVIRLQQQAQARHRDDIDAHVFAVCAEVYGSANPDDEHRLGYREVA